MCSLALNTALAQPPGAAVIIPPTPFPEKNIAPVTSLPKPHFYQPVINCDMLEVGKEVKSIDVASLAKGNYTLTFSEGKRKHTIFFTKQ